MSILSTERLLFSRIFRIGCKIITGSDEGVKGRASPRGVLFLDVLGGSWPILVAREAVVWSVLQFPCYCGHGSLAFALIFVWEKDEGRTATLFQFSIFREEIRMATSLSISTFSNKAPGQPLESSRAGDQFRVLILSTNVVGTVCVPDFFGTDSGERLNVHEICAIFALSDSREGCKYCFGMVLHFVCSLLIVMDIRGRASVVYQNTCWRLQSAE